MVQTSTLDLLQTLDMRQPIKQQSVLIQVFYLGFREKKFASTSELLIGTSSSKSVGAGQYAPLNVQGYIGSAAGGGELCLSRGEAASSITADDQLGAILFTDSVGYGFGSINCKADGTAGSSDYPGRLEFKTAADGSGSMTERMRIGSNGYLYFANQTAANPAAGGSQGLTIRPDPLISIAANGNSCANFGKYK